MVLLAPTLTRAIEAAESFAAGKGSPQEVLESVPEAIQFVTEGVKLYQLLAPGLLRNDSINELLRQIELEQQAQIQGFESVLRGAKSGRHLGLKGTVQSVRTASERLLGLFMQLEDEERKGGVSSNFPVVDALVKTAYNCIQGQIQDTELKPRVDRAAFLLHTLRHDVERFRRLYIDSAASAAVVESTRQPFHLFEAALGAAHSYLQSKIQTQLEDCIRLFLKASPALIEALKQIDKTADNETRFTKTRYLEELGRAASLPRAGQEWLLDQTLARTQQVLEHHKRELNTVADSALHFEVEAELEQAYKDLDAATSAFAAWKSGPPTAGVATLVPPFESLEESYLGLRQRLSAEIQRFSQAAHLGELRDMVGRALLGQLSPKAVGEGIEQARERQQEFLDKLAEGAASSELAELEELVRQHTPGLDQMAFFVEDADPNNLLAGWKQIADTVPRILEINQQLRKQSAAASGAGKPKIVLCPRCGQSNPRTNKNCSSCRSILPQTSVEVVDYTDIIGGSDAQGEQKVPANLAKLAELATQAEAGTISKDYLKNELDRLIEQSEGVSRQFQNQIVPQMGKDPQFDQLVSIFAMRMKQYSDGIHTMRSFVEGGSPSKLKDGVDSCFDAGNHLLGMQEQLREAIKARRS